VRRDYGPVQLADYLRQAHEWVNVDRARRFGLLPSPDRHGGRWSVALAAQIRQEWPEIAAASRCIGAAGLSSRWNACARKVFLYSLATRVSSVGQLSTRSCKYCIYSTKYFARSSSKKLRSISTAPG
jgi:hypothetical protein